MFVYICISHPVTIKACARVRSLDVSDEGDVLQLGEEEQQQALHSHGRHLKRAHKHTHARARTHTLNANAAYYDTVRD